MKSDGYLAGAGDVPVVVRRVVVVVVVVGVLGRSPLSSPHRLLARTLEALLAAQVAAVLEHVARVRVQRPVAALARPVLRQIYDDT